jgi:hypothetical protein
MISRLEYGDASRRFRITGRKRRLASPHSKALRVSYLGGNDASQPRNEAERCVSAYGSHSTG